MKFNNPEKLKKIAKNFTVFAALVLSVLAIFFAPKTFSALPTQDCASYSGTPQQGGNCLYSNGASSTLLPLCSDVRGKTWDTTGAFLSSGAQPRINCLNIIDLPLCNQISDTSTAYPQHNCVSECSSFSDPNPSAIPANVRDQDYAVHNRDCIRFCDAMEGGITANPGENCVSRACHQVAYVGTPTSGNVEPNPPSNCNLLACNLLNPHELNEAKFGDDNTKAYRYCDSDIKCYEFTQAQLPYLTVGSSCKIHDCRVTCVDNATDDVSKILAKGSSYVSSYQSNINFGYEVGSASDQLCYPTVCKPIVKVPYRCEPQSDSDPKTPNSACDSSGDGNKCSSGYCYKTIDCNLSANANSVSCITGGADSEVVGTTDDSTIHSWFYRPKPVDTALNSNGTVKTFRYNSSFSPDKVGYTLGQMRDTYHWGKQAYFEIDFGLLGTLTVDMGYMHSSVFGDGARSPRMDDSSANGNVAELGNRGVGFGYLCNMHANIYNTPREDTAYHHGYVETTFSDTDATHRLSVCLRFTNTLAFDHSCGQRECSLSCVFEKPNDGINGCTQLCGYDICRTLKVKDSDPFQCAMSGSIFDGSGESGEMIGSGATSRDCMMTVDGYLRLRAVKYGDYICTFLDAKGTLAYNAIYFNGSEKLADGTCISGTSNGSGGCSGGKNTNDTPGEATKWRTVMRIPYIKSTQAGGEPQGYLDVTGRLFPAQECIKVYHRITVPPLYNLANVSNSPRIFIPPLYILKSMVKKGSPLVAPIPSGQDLGDTDFHYPEIVINFGTTTQKLSLDFGKTGYEDANSADPLSSATVTTNVGVTDEASYSVEVFIRKEFSEAENRPTLCLYQKVQDVNGVYLDPQKISCVYRNYPEINNSAEKANLSSLDFRKLIVASDSTNTYDSSRIAIQYLSSATNNATCATGGTSCTTTLLLTNADQSSETCDTSVEKHKICVQRDECSKLNIECIKNEIDLHIAEVANQPTDSFKIVQNQCNDVLLPYCNGKFGIAASATATITNTNPGNAAGDANAYGWFNELCVSSGFDTKFKEIVAYRTDSGVTGKCIVDIANKAPGADCSAGGKKPDCPCLVYNKDAMSLPANQTFRIETPHEAGLCINIPLPQVCQAVNHNPVPNSDTTDSDYIQTSLNQTTYGTTTSQIAGKVHISHQYRTSGLSPTIPIAGHAEFPQSIFGFDDVRGTCTGFWKQATNGNGNSVPPTMSCLNSGGTAVWGSVSNACVRYSCPAISTAGMDSSGNYQGGYGVLESGENKGLSNGFANWPETQSSDFPTSATATSCIVGFKTVGAVTQKPVSESVDYAALFNHITGYSVVTLPTRQCNQIGQWQTPTNNCVRISCDSINLDDDSYTDTDGDGITITNASGTIDWALWTNSGGATFPKVNAARSTTLINGSTVKTSATSTGTCNNSLGFFQMIGAPAPTRVCNYLGNWEAVQNQCITQCDAVADIALASTTSNGYAYWYKAVNVPISGELSTNTNGCSSPSNPQFTESGVCQTTGFKGCVSGYIPSPYPPLLSKYGIAYTLANCGTGLATCATNNIPQDVTKDTRPAANPERVCKYVVVEGGYASIWTSTSSSCVNSCPGYDVDPRFNAGKTQHPTSQYANDNVGGVVTINWPTTSFGQTAYINSPNDINSQNGSQYFYGRQNGYYTLSRYCNPTTHKWDAPIAYCVTNGTQIKVGPNNIADSNATYSSPTRVAVGSQTANGSCTSGTYSDTNGSTVASPATCSYKDGTQKIDEVYFDTGSSKKCNAMCRSKGGDTFGNAVDPNANSYIYYSTGAQLNLNCQSGYGSDIISGTSTSDSFSNCGRSPNDRSANRPYVACNDNGNGTASWSSTVYNNCEICRTCSYSGTPYDINTEQTLTSSGNCGNKNYKDSPQELMATAYQDCASSFLNVSNSACVGVKFYSQGHWSCTRTCSNGVGDCTRHTDLNVAFSYQCKDGMWYYNACTASSYPDCY